jgi:hypothetical protein
MLNKLSTVSTPFLAFLQASGFLVYLILIGLFFNYMIPYFAGANEKFYAPLVMLLLFVMSAVISALLILGRASVYFWEKNYKKALELTLWTVGWGMFYLVLLLILIKFCN